MKHSLLFTCFATALYVSRAASALADDKPVPTSEAAERFDRAIRLVDDGDLSGGLAEFQRAYALEPSPVVLYNLGLVYAALRRPVEAVKATEQALAHPDALDREDRERASAVLNEQRRAIGHINLVASVKEGVVEIDNVEVAHLPLSEALAVSAGSHVVGVVSAGFAPARREVVVAGGEIVAARLDLVAIEGRLAHALIRCRVPAADVSVDGERVGKTPLEKTISVAPGTHVFEVKRTGYQSVSRSLTLEDGSEGELVMNPVIDPSSLHREGGYLSVLSSETQSVVSVDGDESALLTGPLRLPSGPHRIHVERGGFLPADRDVVVPLGRTGSVTVVFEPTPETRASYVEHAETRRTWSLITMASGIVIGAGGVALAFVENGQLPGARNTLAAVNLDAAPHSGRVCDDKQPQTDSQIVECATRLNDATSRINNLQLGRTVGWIAAGVGGAVLVTGTALLLGGDNPHKYDEKPVERALAGWSLFPMPGRGMFLSRIAAF